MLSALLSVLPTVLAPANAARVTHFATHASHHGDAFGRGGALRSQVHEYVDHELDVRDASEPHVRDAKKAHLGSDASRG